MISPKKPYLFGRPCFVYVVRCAEFTKVGIALDTVKRISSMLTNCPFPIELIARRQFPSEEVARGVEQMIHSALETQAHRGEWFVHAAGLSADGRIDFNDPDWPDKIGRAIGQAAILRRLT